MKVLVATEATQKWRANDFSWADVGEPVVYGMVCDRDRRPDGSPDPDGWCGCGRSFEGLHSGLGTTTAVVAQVEMGDHDETVAAFVKRMAARHGWLKPDDPDHARYLDELAAEVEELLEIAGGYPVGTVVELRGEQPVVRPEEAKGHTTAQIPQ